MITFVDVDEQSKSDYELYLRFKGEVLRPFFKELNECERSSEATEVLELLLKTSCSAFDNIVHLRFYQAGSWAHIGSVTLRVLHDISLQALYIVHENSKIESKALDFKEWVWIEQNRLLASIQTAYDGGSTSFERIVNSPLRLKNEVWIRSQYERAKRRFLRTNGKLVGSWYRHENLRELSVSLNLLGEYLGIVKPLHGITHCSPYSLIREAAFSHNQCFVFTLRLLERTMFANAVCRDLKLNDNIWDSFNQSREDITER